MNMKTVEILKQPGTIKTVALSLLLLILIFTQVPGAQSFIHDTREHLFQWSVEKAVSAAARELRKRARFQ